MGARGRKASHTSLGPRSEPPIPIWITVWNGRPVAPTRTPVRTASEKLPSLRRIAVTSRETEAPPATNLVPGGARNAMCRAARPSEALTISPPNSRARARSRPTASANRSALLKSSRDQGCLERSRRMPAAVRESFAIRSGSARNKSTIRRARTPVARDSRSIQADASSVIEGSEPWRR